MLAFRLFILAMIIVTSSIIGILFSKKYANREKEIKEMKNALNMFATKIKFTYEPIPNVFMEIANKIGGNVGNIFFLFSNRMKEAKQKSSQQSYSDKVISKKEPVR